VTSAGQAVAKIAAIEAAVFGCAFDFASLILAL